MVRLYTSGKYFKDNEIIIDNDSFFNNNVMWHQRVLLILFISVHILP